METSSAVRYLVDEKGQRVGVLLSMDDYRQLMDELEELEAIRAYDAAKASPGPAITLEEVVSEIEEERGGSRN